MNIKTKAKSKNHTGTILLLFIIITGGIFYYSYVAFALLMIGFIPTFVALFIDKTPEKYLAITVFGGNLMGCAVPLSSVFSISASMPFLRKTMFDSYNWLWIYSGASFGWLLFFIIPPIVINIIAIVDKLQLELLKNEQQKLIDEWGKEVKGN